MRSMIEQNADHLKGTYSSLALLRYVVVGCSTQAQSCDILIHHISVYPGWQLFLIPQSIGDPKQALTQFLLFIDPESPTLRATLAFILFLLTLLSCHPYSRKLHEASQLPGLSAELTALLDDQTHRVSMMTRSAMRSTFQKERSGR